jgi:hypothetical protein
MSMKRIREYYNVPAKRGARVEYGGDDLAKFIRGFMYAPKKGTVVGSRGDYIRVRFDGSSAIETLHPTWKVRYL